MRFTRNAVDSNGERAAGGRICGAFRHLTPIAGRAVNRRCRCADGKSSRRGGCGYPGPGTTRHAVHFTGECDLVRPDARCGVWTTGFPTTKKAVRWNGERRRPIARETCLVRTFRASREIRNAVHSNGVRGSSTGPHPHRDVDILPQASLESLCISMVSVGDRSDRASARAPVSDRRLRLRGSRILTALAIARFVRVCAAMWISGRRNQSTCCVFQR